MRSFRSLVAVVALGCVAIPSAQSPSSSPQASATPVIPEYVPPEVVQLTARTLRVYKAPDASQGVAAGLHHFFAVDNTVLAKHEIRTGRLIDRWIGPRN